MVLLGFKLAVAPSLGVERHSHRLFQRVDVDQARTQSVHRAVKCEPATLRRASGFGEIASATGRPPHKRLLVTLPSAPQSEGANDENGSVPARHAEFVER